MGSFNIESGENALTPMFNLGDEHRAILFAGPRKRERERKNGEKAKDSKEWLTCSIESRPGRNDDFSLLKFLPFIPVYFARLFAPLL